MIDPMGINMPEIVHDHKGSILTLDDIPPYDAEDYDLSSPKEFSKYLKDIESSVRTSFEYREFTKFLRNYYGMYVSGSFANITGLDSSVKIEIHHTPFSLFDIVVTVQEKRKFFHQDLSVEMVAKEVMELHYKQLIGLYPLTQTEHELVHNGYLFIPVDRIFGRYDLFRNLYMQFIPPELLETLDRVEEFSRETHEVERMQQNLLLTQSNIYLDTSGSYSLPILDKLKNVMNNRIDQIKSNAYLLPSFEEEDNFTSNIKDDRKLKDLVSFN